MAGERDRFTELDRLFQAVCDLAPDQREPRLIELAPNDPEIRSEVLELLASETAASRGLSAEQVRSQIRGVLDVDARDPDEVAGYRILGRLGMGGMGVVYEAEQRSPHRRVALKLLRPGLASPDLVRRFQFEAEALGRLRHPGIAQVYEAGVETTAAGPRPYFAMELVPGRRLTDWARGRPTRDRLRIMAEVCDAVQHAHARGVMHRDLKPANVLVTEDDQPKILDFGVARAVDRDGADQSLQTIAGQLVGTLGYMSPEQLAADPTEVDTRSDVYALGVMLYEVLAGQMPHEVAGLGLLEAADLVRGSEPTRLGSVDTRFRGDVDIITRKALEKDRDRRYQTAAELGEDIRRYLDGQTITARPASAIYQLSRVARRHMPVTVASAIALLTLVAAVIGVTLALRESVAQQAEAERRASIAEAVTSFFNEDVLAAVEPNALGHEATVREALDVAAERVPGSFAGDPVTGAAVRNNIANVYHVLGEYELAASFAVEARDLFLRELGERHELARFAQQDVGAIYRDLGRFEESREELLRALEMRDRTVGRTSPESIENVVMLAEVERDGFGDLVRASEWLDEYDRRTRGLASVDERIETYAEMTRGGMALASRDYETAAASYAIVAEARERLYGTEHSATLTAWSNLAVAYEALGRYSDAEPIYLRVLGAEERMGGLDNPDRLPTAHNLAFLYESMGRYDEAEALFIDTLERCRRVYGPLHPGTLTCVQSLSSLYRSTDRFDLAIGTLESPFEEATAELGESSPQVLEMASKLGVLYTQVGRAEEGEAVLGRSVPHLRELVPPGHPLLGQMLSQWGASLHALGRSDEAIERLTEAHQILDAAAGAQQESDAREAASRLAEIYRALGDAQQAEQWEAAANVGG